MDTGKFVDSAYVTVEDVESGKAKKICIFSEGNEKQIEYQGETRQRFVLDVGFGDKFKMYTPNKDSIKNMQSAWGMDSKNWVNRWVDLSIYNIKGKKTILALPSVVKV
jgi:hypothetical protein